MMSNVSAVKLIHLVNAQTRFNLAGFFYERHFALSSMPNVNRCFSIDNAIFSSRNLNPTRLRFFFARKPQARQNFLELGNPKKKEFLLIGLQRAQRVREIISIPRNKAHPVSILLEKYI